jgi:heme exporter protein CcmD
MEAMRDFLAMGGYASFVWPAYAVAATVLAGLSLHSLVPAIAGERVVIHILDEYPGSDADRANGGRTCCA